MEKGIVNLNKTISAGNYFIVSDWLTRMEKSINKIELLPTIINYSRKALHRLFGKMLLNLLTLLATFSCSNVRESNNENQRVLVDSMDFNHKFWSVKKGDSILIKEEHEIKNKTNRLSELKKLTPFWYKFPEFVSENDFLLILTDLKGKYNSLINDEGDFEFIINGKQYFAEPIPHFNNDSLYAIELKFFTNKETCNKYWYISEENYLNLIAYYKSQYKLLNAIPYNRPNYEFNSLIKNNSNPCMGFGNKIIKYYPSYEFMGNSAKITLSDTHSIEYDKYKNYFTNF